MHAVTPVPQEVTTGLSNEMPADQRECVTVEFENKMISAILKSIERCSNLLYQNASSAHLLVTMTVNHLTSTCKRRLALIK